MLNLKAIRDGRGRSQQEVAEYLGITRQAYSNYEIGKRSPDNETLLKLAEYFDVSTDFILRGEATPLPTGVDLTEEMNALLESLTVEQEQLLCTIAKKWLQYAEAKSKN